MHTLTNFCKKLRLGKVLGAFLAGCILFLNVACSSENAGSARPNNPPVQMGGQNNPYKAGGDGYSNSQMSTDTITNKRDRAEALSSNQFIATVDKTLEQSFSALKNQVTGATSVRPEDKAKESLQAVQQMPEQRQDVLDRSDPDAKILEKVGTTFKEASKHLTGSTDKSIEKSGMIQAH